MRVEKTFVVETRAFDDETRTFEAVASTEAPDRWGDVVKQDGWELDNFKKNPVLLWMHKYDEPPIGKVVDIRVEGGKLVFKAQFADEGTHPLADTAYQLYKQGILRAFSVGFIPKEFDHNEHGGYTYRRQELLEISAVTVPANQEALIMALKSLVARNEPEENTEKAVPPQHQPPLDEDSAWDKTKAINQLRKWASKDGSGDKDTIDWNKYRMGFGWYDAENKENFGSYKLPHHYVEDGQLTTAKRGVIAAMAALMGARGGVDIPDDDVPRVYGHLAHHYEQWDGEPPPLKMVETIRTIMKEFDDVPKELEAFIELIAEDVNIVIPGAQEIKRAQEVVKDLIKTQKDKINELEMKILVLEARIELLKNTITSNANADKYKIGSSQDNVLI